MISIKKLHSSLQFLIIDMSYCPLLPILAYAISLSERFGKAKVQRETAIFTLSYY